MKVYTPSDFKKLAIEMLEKTFKENPKKLVVGWISSSALENELGKISYIQICEKVINSQKDFDRWQQRIQIIPQKIIKYYDTEKGKFRNFKDVVKDVKKCDKFIISVCVKILKNLKERKYLVKLFDKYFLMKTKYNLKYDLNKKFCYAWFCVCDEKENHTRVDNAEFVEISKDRAMAELI